MRALAAIASALALMSPAHAQALETGCIPFTTALSMAAAFSPGAIVADVSRRYDVATSLIYKWRRQLIEAREAASFVPAVMIDGAVSPALPARSEAAILVEMAGGTRVKIGADASLSAITATLRALR